MNSKNLEALDKKSTGDLMTYLTNLRRTGGQWTPSEASFTVDEILQVLKDRPHSPNKEEARMIRQDAARSRDRGGKRDR